MATALRNWSSVRHWFTMSLFIGALAFPDSPHLVAEVKVGVLMGSILSAILGVVVLLRAKRQRSGQSIRCE